jgi:hypothetical protein
MKTLRHPLTSCLPSSASNHEPPSFQSLSSRGHVYVKHVHDLVNSKPHKCPNRCLTRHPHEGPKLHFKATARQSGALAWLLVCAAPLEPLVCLWLPRLRSHSMTDSIHAPGWACPYCGARRLYNCPNLTATQFLEAVANDAGVRKRHRRRAADILRRLEQGLELPESNPIALSIKLMLN